MMTIPGLALFYAGMVRKKNVLATMAQSLAATFLISLLWAVVGYSLVFTAQHGSIRAGMDPHELPRVKVENGDTQALFGRLCDGALDAWRLVDAGLSRLQRPVPGVR